MMKNYNEAKTIFKAIELLQLTQPEYYGEFLEQFKVCESESNYKLIRKLSDLRWNLSSYLQTVPGNEFKKIKAIGSVNKQTRKCFFDLFKEEKIIYSEDENLFFSLINVLNDLGLNNKQRLNWINIELIENSTRFEKEFLDILYQSHYNSQDVLDYFKKMFKNKNAYDLAINGINEFLKLHLGISTRVKEFDQNDLDIAISRKLNSYHNSTHPSDLF